jgi:DNA invertase Pin-like site-specific DNA recombinase
MSQLPARFEPVRNRRNKCAQPRVSTPGSGQSPEMQPREPVEYCDRRRWKIVGEYIDAVSRAKKRRSGLS